MDSILRFVESNGMPGACLAAALGVSIKEIESSGTQLGNP